MQKLIVSFIAVLGAWASSCGLATAAAPTPLGADAFGRLPNIEMMDLSPGGTKLAYVVVQGDQRLFVVKDLSDKLIFQEKLGDNKVRYAAWADDDHVMIGVGGVETIVTWKDEFLHTYVINVRTGKGLWVFDTTPGIMHSTYGYEGSVTQAGHAYGYFGGVTLSKTRGFDATFNDQNFVDLYRVDLDSGAAELAASGQQHPHEWAVDASGKVEASSTYNDVTGDWTLRVGKDSETELTTIRRPLGDIALRDWAERREPSSSPRPSPRNGTSRMALIAGWRRTG